MIEYIVKVNDDGDKEWYLNGKLHREDGPAIEYISGYKEWWLNGKLHRKPGPAKEWVSGTKQWYLNDKRHREDGPAIEWDDGSKFWFLNDIGYTEKEFNKKIKETHILILDGKEVKISNQSFEEFKKALKD